MKHLHIIGLLALVALATGCTTRVGPRTGITREQAIRELNDYLSMDRQTTANTWGIHHQHEQVTYIRREYNATYYYGQRWPVFHAYTNMTEVGVQRYALGLVTLFIMDPTLGSGVYVKFKNDPPEAKEVFSVPFGLYSFFPFYLFKPAALQARKPAETLEALRLNKFDPAPAAATETK